MLIVKRKNSTYSISLCSSIINPRWNYCEQFCKFNFRSFKTTSSKLKMHRLLCKITLYNFLPPCVYVRVDIWFVYLLQIYFFIFIFWLWWVLVAAQGFSLVAASGTALHCGAQASCCCGFSLVAEHRLWACRLQHLQHLAHGLRRIMPCGKFLDQGPNPCPLHCMVAC